MVQLALMKLLPEADKACKDLSRMFYGGKEVIFHDYGATIDVARLLLSLCEYLTVSDNKNYATSIKRFCQRIGLDMLNGLPYIEILSDEESKEIPPELYKYNRKVGVSLQNAEEQVVLHFNENLTELKAKSMGEGKFAKVDINANEQSRNIIKHFDFAKLSERCRLYAEIRSGDYWGFYPELFGLATNLMTVEGGKTKFMNAIGAHPNYYDLRKWEYTMTSIKKLGYLPSNCNNFCPFKDDCEHSKNVIETVKLIRGRVNIVEPLKAMSLEEAEQKLKEAFEKALASQDNKVFVIKAPTGIGKTELYLTLENTTIALPRHDLKDEVAKRMKVEHKVIPKLSESNENFIEELGKLYAKGDYWGASELKNRVAQYDDEVAEYLKTIELFKNAKGTLLTTHERLMFTDDNNTQVVVDEDVISTMLKVTTVDIKDIAEIANKIVGFEKVIEIIRSKKVGVLNSVDLEFRWNMSLLPEEKAEFLKSLKTINSNVVDFLSCCYWMKNPNETISYIVKREMGRRKTIILSATANKFIYEKLFGDRLVFIDIGAVETKGKIVQYPQSSFSRYQIEHGKERLNLAKSIVGDQPVITFKRYACEFKNCIAKYGALTGTDEYAGQDMAIVGTPHINANAYLLYAAALCGEEFTNAEMRYIPIKHKGMEFYFNTFENEVLREVQLFLIEAELIQAIGRARILRKDCTVTVLSNLAIPGAKFVYLDKSQIKELSEASFEEVGKEEICESPKKHERKQLN
ncbi:hypothetical protein [Azotosporobacter soli]|uniref:hypothetical protein n=1 Tax=Azotosporobacter soli TaxID=3055040 RepID=UPI0031FEE4FE